MVHVRKIGDRILDFGVSGSLWKDALVMYDRATHSLWSHVVGECIEGALVGSRLAAWPVTMTTFRDWVAQHPSTLVLVKGPGDARDSHYREYKASDQQGIFGTIAKRAELEAKEIVQGLSIAGEAVAIPVAACRQGVPVQFKIGDRRFVALKVGDAVTIYERVLGGKASPTPREVPSTTAYWFAWLNFHPKTRVVR